MDYDAYVSLCEEALASEAGWWSRNWLTNRGLKPRSIQLYRLGYDQDRKAIVIPYLNAMEEVRGFRWRLQDSNIKYMTPKGQGGHLFHVRKSRKSNVWLCEGEFDTIILNQMGFDAVGIPGASSFKSEWKYLFAYCDTITIVMDGDDAGREAAARLSGILGVLDGKTRVVRLDPGKDVTDMYLEDPARLKQLVS